MYIEVMNTYIYVEREYIWEDYINFIIYYSDET